MRKTATVILITALLTAITLGYQFHHHTAKAQVTLVAGAGDITANDGAGAATANQVTALNPDGVITMGDNQYPDGCLSDFNGSSGYNSSWGAFLAKTRPAIGNHDSHNTACSSSGNGYFDYFNGVGSGTCTLTCRAGQRGAGWYSYDIGDWHMIVLNSECNNTQYSFCSNVSQKNWLAADLAANTKYCTMAYWHRPIIAPSGTHSDDEGNFAHNGGGVIDSTTPTIWQILYDNNVDLVLQGHDHLYASTPRLGRAFPPVADSAGIRTFDVGTGGSGLYSGNDSPVALDALDSADHGVFKLTLNPSDYSWAFLPTDGSYSGTGSSTGSDTCRGNGSSPTPTVVPTPTPSATPTSTPSSTVTLTPTPSTTPGPGDSDGDGWSNSHETYMSTNPNSACGFDAWPPDFNNDGYSDGTDGTMLAGWFGKAVPLAPARYDIWPAGGDGYVDGTDITRLAGFFGKTCTTVYYIDPAGSDSNDGLAPATAWATVGKVNSVNQAGKTFLFKRGGIWTQQLVLNTAIITRIDAYGSGAQPKISTQSADCVRLVSAVNTTIRNLRAESCQWAGFQISGAGTRNVVLDNIFTTLNVAGVQLQSSTDASTFTQIINSNITNNNRMSVDTVGGTDDSGAFGVLVNGGKLLMENNNCSGQDAHSYDFGRDGACVEFYQGGAGSIVRKNRAASNDAFSETDASVGNIIYVQNHIYGSSAHATGIVALGSADIIVQNTIWLPTDGTHGPITDINRGAQAIVGGPGMTLRDNIAHGGWKDVYVSSAPASEGYNDFPGAVQGFSLAATDITANPLLVSDTDRHLQSTSPAIDAGDPAPLESYLSPTDMDNDAIPLGSYRDIGTDEAQ